jgi:hypothetical protein
MGTRPPCIRSISIPAIAIVAIVYLFPLPSPLFPGFSAALNFADLDLGFRSDSSSLATTGFFVNTSRLPSLCASRKLSFTRRSSSEWKLIITTLPPGFSNDPALRSSVWISPNSSFTRIRSAWNVRVAGWIWLPFP